MGSASAPDKAFVVTRLGLGIFGVDRCYLGLVGTSLLKLFTISRSGIWWLVDLISVLAGTQRDKGGQKAGRVQPARKLRQSSRPSESCHR